MGSSNAPRARLRAMHLVATLCALGACFPSEFEIEVKLSYPNGHTITGAEITAIPFDRDALRDSIADLSDTPRPGFAELEREMVEYERPDLSGLAGTFEPWQAIYDSVRSLADSLNSIEPNRSTEYIGGYARLREQYQRLAQSTAQRDAELREHVGDDRDLARRAAAAADSLRAWEGHALGSLPEAIDTILVRDGRSVHRATTGVDGSAKFTLPPGRWWIVARTEDAGNPFVEVYWNVGVTVRLIGSKTITLNDGNGARRWRY